MSFKVLSIKNCLHFIVIERIIFFMVGITSNLPSMQVFQKGSLIVKDFSEAILRLSEDGTLTNLEDNWLTPSRGCSTDQTSSDTYPLSMQSFWGLYLISAAISTICFLLSLIWLLKNYQHPQEAKEDNATPSPIRVWNMTIGLAKYFYNGEIITPGRASSSSRMPDLHSWTSLRWEDVRTIDIPHDINQASTFWNWSVIELLVECTE